MKSPNTAALSDNDTITTLKLDMLIRTGIAARFTAIKFHSLLKLAIIFKDCINFVFIIS